MPVQACQFDYGHGDHPYIAQLVRTGYTIIVCLVLLRVIMVEWKNLTDERYEVSTNGDIRNKKTGRILKQSPNQHGYSRVSLSQGAGKIPTIVFPPRIVTGKQIGRAHV